MIDNVNCYCNYSCRSQHAIYMVIGRLALFEIIFLPTTQTIYNFLSPPFNEVQGGVCRFGVMHKSTS